MIETLMSDDLIKKAGGRFRLTTLIQKRWLELLQGARPLIDPRGLTEMEIVIEEIAQDKVSIDFEASGLSKPNV